MRRMLLFAGLAGGLLLIAAGLGARDAPYIALTRGDVQGALPGLIRKGEEGDGFAAYRVGRAYHLQRVEGGTLEQALAWYLKAARGGEIRAVASYVEIALAQDPGSCERAIPLLDLAARARDAGALLMLSEIYRNGRCGLKDMRRAAAYRVAAGRLDRRLSVVVSNGTADTANVAPFPERFDLDAGAVLGQFVSEAPTLMAGRAR